MMQRPDYEKAWQYALERMKQELSPVLHYHCLQHTRDSVVPAVDRLAALSGVEGESLLLLRTAAHYHDLGFIVQPVNHETIGIDIAASVLPGMGFTQRQIDIIRDIILATRLPQTPHNLLEELMADADLDALGRDDFWQWNNALREEWAALRGDMTDEKWYENQLQFLRAHRYFTPAARQLREEAKQVHIREIASLLEQARAVHTAAPKTT